MSNTASAKTKAQILDVTERSLAERGFAATTMRSIAAAADVNLAAVNYHFGSKEELLRAVVARIAQPIVERHRVLLHQLNQEKDRLAVEDILWAFMLPAFEIITRENESIRITRARFMGRCRTEPEPARSIAQNEFGMSMQMFLEMLQQVLPDQSSDQLYWKLDLVVAALIRVLSEAGTPGALLQGNEPAAVEDTVAKLVAFLAPGVKLA